jgi:tyrosyl-DNA phosphodiesterase-1
MSDYEPRPKKRKLASDNSLRPSTASLASLSRAITPPPRSSTGTPADEHDLPLRSQSNPSHTQVQGEDLATENESETDADVTANAQRPTKSPPKEVRFLPSPVQLTRIRDLPASSNVDTVGLNDLLGDPLIKELWNFNFLFDLDFVM